MNKRIASELNRVARAICTNRVVISAKDFSPQIAYVKNVFRKKNCTVDFEVKGVEYGLQYGKRSWITTIFIVQNGQKTMSFTHNMPTFRKKSKRT